MKHAHSQRNPEKDWGRFTLQAVELAYWALNDRYGIALPHRLKLRTIRPENTIVIASSISNRSVRPPASTSRRRRWSSAASGARSGWCRRGASSFPSPTGRSAR